MADVSGQLFARHDVLPKATNTTLTRPVDIVRFGIQVWNGFAAHLVPTLKTDVVLVGEGREIERSNLHR